MFFLILLISKYLKFDNFVVRIFGSKGVFLWDKKRGASSKCPLVFSP